MSAICDGIVPEIVALVRDKDASEVKKPNSVGSVPVISLESSQIATANYGRDEEEGQKNQRYCFSQ